MGATVATNALLERRGEPTLLAITDGHTDALRIGYQSRPRLFARHIVLPEPLYAEVMEVSGRVGFDGRLLGPLDEGRTRAGLQAFDRGLRAVAIVLMHGYRFIGHEQRVAAIAREVGFTQVSASHEVSALMKLVARGDTTAASPDGSASPPPLTAAILANGDVSRPSACRRRAWRSRRGAPMGRSRSWRARRWCRSRRATPLL